MTTTTNLRDPAQWKTKADIYQAVNLAVNAALKGERIEVGKVEALKTDLAMMLEKALGRPVPVEAEWLRGMTRDDILAAADEAIRHREAEDGRSGNVPESCAGKIPAWLHEGALVRLSSDPTVARPSPSGEPHETREMLRVGPLYCVKRPVNGIGRFVATLTGDEIRYWEPVTPG